MVETLPKTALICMGIRKERNLGTKTKAPQPSLACYSSRSL